jgi:hypothetical protein
MIRFKSRKQMFKYTRDFKYVTTVWKQLESVEKKEG